MRLSQICDSQLTASDRNVHMFIDEWIWMVMTKPSAEMIMKTRQYFIRMYNQVLRHCTDQEMWRRDASVGCHYAVLTETLSKILESEESSAGFAKPQPISFLPSTQLEQKKLDKDQLDKVKKKSEILRQIKDLEGEPRS